MNFKHKFSQSKPATVVITEEMEERGHDNWAKVELFRWQHGELPKSDDTRKLDVAVASKKMANALLDRENNIGPFQAAAVIRYLGKRAGEKP